MSYFIRALGKNFSKFSEIHLGKSQEAGGAKKTLKGKTLLKMSFSGVISMILEFNENFYI